jgi:hypothetical protein
MDQGGSSSLIETASAATCLDPSFSITSAYTHILYTSPFFVVYPQLSEIQQTWPVIREYC